MEGINTNDWQHYETYDTYHEAFCMIGFAKNQGYAAAKIQELPGGKFAVFTLKLMKGAKLQ